MTSVSLSEALNRIGYRAGGREIMMIFRSSLEMQGQIMLDVSIVEKRIGKELK
jgi:hypothetical protein